MAKIAVHGYRCERCLHEWVPHRFLGHPAEDLSQVQEPLLGHAKENYQELTASRADSCERQPTLR